MKRNFNFLLAALTVIAAVSCQKAETKDSESSVKLVDKSFVAECEVTKTYIANEGTEIWWEEGDDIAIFDGISSDAHRFTVSDINGRSATFNGQVSEGATEFYAVYPYSAAVSLEGTALNATLPVVQKLGANNASQGAFLAVGKIDENGALQLQNVFSRIRVKVTYADVSEIVVGGAALAGTAAFNSADGSLAGTPSDPQASVTLLPQEGSSVFTPGTYYISLLPGTTPENSFSVTMKRPVAIADGALAYSATQTAASAVTLKQKGGIKFDELDSKLEWTIHLSSKEELTAWNNAYAAWKANDKVFLDQDIELDNDAESEAWESHDFPGTFDGQGHSITKIHVENAGHANFFGVCTGEIKNLTFGAEGDGSYFRGGTDDNASYCISPVKSVSGEGKLTGITNYATVELTGTSGYYVAGVCAIYDASTVMSACKNYGKVSVTGNPSTYTNLAGVVAYSGSAVCTLDSCENHGQVIFEGESTALTLNHGGVVGYIKGKTTVKNCMNTGLVAISESMKTPGNVYRIGGLVGLNQIEGATMTDCRNEGEVRCDASSFNVQSLFMGGILGQSDTKTATSVTIASCENAGAITAAVKENAGMVVIGGILSYVSKNTASDAVVGSLSISSCTNTAVLADLSARSEAKQSTVAGIVGFNQMAMTISDCVNGESGTVKGEILKNGTGQSSRIILAGILGWNKPVTYNVATTVDNCTNYAPVGDKGDEGGTYIYLSGICPAHQPNSANTAKYNTLTIKNTRNYGDITNYATSTSQVRMGGFMGDSANNTVITDCANYGNISHIGVYTVSEGIRLAGLVGSSTKGSTGVKFTNCSNYGNLYCENTSSSATNIARMGGMIAYSALSNVTFSSCKSSCRISTEGTITTRNARMIVACSTQNLTVKDCGIAGNILGTALTSANFADYIYYTTNTATVSGNYYMGSDAESFDPLDDDITLE